MHGILSRERIIARPGFNRWLVPPAALAIHLSIGMAYGFSVFWLPLSRALGVSQPIACPEDIGILARIISTACDWEISLLGWMYTLFFVFLGSSAALFGAWLERAGPRKAGVAAALCWSGGLLISALGVYVHQLWLLWLGSGVIGGIGLGLGYISPVSTLIKWFPDRRGMATGMAIMGFGGGAMIGAPLADRLMKFYASADSVGVWETFLTLAAIYFIAMMAGALGYRIPQPGWKPAGWTPPGVQHRGMVTARNVHVSVAWRTPQFWLLWGVLCLNVTAGIGVIGMASPMVQEVFGGALLDLPLRLGELTGDQRLAVAAIGAGFAGLLSLFNIVGRIAWALCSDSIGRKPTYALFFAGGALLYALVPWAGRSGQVALFVVLFCAVLTMYGGGFATIPAYIADLFGTQFVSAIHGRLLTAWATAGIVGPVIVNYARELQIDRGVPVHQAYDVPMYVMAAMLVLGFVCNLLIRPVAEGRFMIDGESSLEHNPSLAAPRAIPVAAPVPSCRSSRALVIVAWTLVGVPMAWGIWNTLSQAWVLFG